MTAARALLALLLCMSPALAKKPKKKVADPAAAMAKAVDARGDAVGQCVAPTLTIKAIHVSARLVVNATGQLIDSTITTDAADGETIRQCVAKALSATPYPPLPRKTPLLTMERTWTFQLQP